jgi:hypothetical protein
VTLPIVLTALGYLALIVGGYLLYANVPPYKPYGAIAVSNAAHQANLADLRRRQRNSRCGFGLFLIGTLLQAVSWTLQIRW